MIETSLNEILAGHVQISGYRVYAIDDKQGRCLYVGNTKNLKSRVRQHLTGKGELREYLVECDDLRMMVYDREDVDRIVLTREPDLELPHFSNEKEWAEDAEWYMCDVLRPYINRRKTYKPHVNAVISLARNGILPRDEACQKAVQVLHDWNVTKKRFDEEEKAIRRKLGLAENGEFEREV